MHIVLYRHLEGGFAVVFAEDASDVQANVPLPDAWNQLCPTYDSLTGTHTFNVDLYVCVF